MSIDHVFYVPAGFRNLEPKGTFGEHKDCMHAHQHAWTPHQVFFAHGANFLIDEQYTFEDPEDARWFFDEGYKRMLYEGEPEPDRMALWINDEEADHRGYKPEERFDPGNVEIYEINPDGIEEL